MIPADRLTGMMWGMDKGRRIIKDADAFDRFRLGIGRAGYKIFADR